MSYSKGDIEQLWVKEGGDPSKAGLAASIALAESSGDPNAENHNTNGTVDRGLFQVNSIHGVKSTKDVRSNVRAAIAISGNGKNFKPWVTFNTGAYRKHLGSASKTVGKLTSTPKLTTTISPGATKVDADAAIVDSLLASGQHGVKGSIKRSRLTDAADRIASGAYTTTTPASSKTTLASAAKGKAATIAPAGGDLAAQLTDRANTINAKHLPYKWGGGHAGKTDPNAGVPVDCSGAVSEVLGINPKVAADFQKWGKPGAGGKVTIYAKSSHVLMEINGHFFGTSASNPGGGAGWIPRGQISPAYLKGFTVRHA